MMNSTSMTYNRMNVRTTRGNARKRNKLSEAQAQALLVVMKWGFALMFAIILFSGALMVMTEAMSDHPAEPTEGESVVNVAPGDTLWSIASATGNGDIRERVFEIKLRNNLDSDELKAGQQLIIPA
ncbi:LysM domain-containing protein [Paenibacillus cellulosilyticus]|uniref:LysM domain-containing protein n=1 Tax=Paenibacillus cellulosilyticus TaxID=375489 RepID=A0A2V2YRN8_9BACL|nr:LysM peptidoglycan-binding domain-containing protein [Paenibacillus cellulosilyticus]PWW00674.1 LysM domain-containing protein [Paenibacillus cellulosilyticus]